MAKNEKAKVIAPTKNKQVETLDDIEVEDVSQSIPNSEIVQVEEKKPNDKGNKIFGEIKAFLILVIIIGLIGGGTWYWYTHFYDANKNKTTETTPESKDEYKVISYVSKEKNHDLFVLGEYLIERTENHVVKVMDLSTNVLYDDKIECSDVYLGIDNKLYFVLDESGDYENSITLYRLEDKKIVEVQTIENLGVYYSPLVYEKSDTIELIGFAGSLENQTDDGDSSNKEYIVLLDGTSMELENATLFGNTKNLGTSEPIKTSSSQYIITVHKVGEKDLFGLYDLKNKKVIIEPSYDVLKEAGNDRYVAVKNGKAGIINAKREILVDYKYDFIDVNDGFFVVSKDKKLAIMNDQYKLVTDFAFDYQGDSEIGDIEYGYYLCCSSINSFEAYKVGDKYVLITNVGDYGYYNYDKHTAYFIEPDGSSKEIEERYLDVKGNFIYSEIGDNKFVVYDEDLNEKYNIDLTKYDYDIYYLNLINGNTIVAYSDNNEVYMDYKTGEEIKSMMSFEKNIDTFQLKYANNKLVIKTSEKNEISFDVNDFNYDSFVKLDDKHYYYINESANNSLFVMIMKEE